MGKRKPQLPRRRLGVHFADVAVQRNVHAHALRGSLLASTAALPTVSMNGAWGSAASEAAGASPPQPASDDSSPSPTASPAHPTPGVAAQKERVMPSLPMRPFGKSIVSTVALQDTHDAVDEQGKSLDDTVTIKMSELEAWKQHTIMQIEDHFTNEQLKRIAEFGRVHANLVKEAKEYVSNVETQLKEQFERDRESLKSQAEAYVAQFQQESEDLRRQVKALEEELEELRSRKNKTEEKELSSASTLDAEADELQPSAKRGRRSDSADILTCTESPPPSPSVSSSPTDDEALAVDDVAETMSRAMGIQTPLRLKSQTTRGTASEGEGAPKVPSLPL